LPEGVLLATVSGSVSLEDAVKRFQETFAFAAENNTRKILFNCLDTTGDLSTTDSYRFATRVMQYLRSLNIGNPAIALVGKPRVFTGFGLQVAQNLGALALGFAEIKSALAWLTSPPLHRS
jgi:hypothetical protein